MLEYTPPIPPRPPFAPPPFPAILRTRVGVNGCGRGCSYPMPLRVQYKYVYNMCVWYMVMSFVGWLFGSTLFVPPRRIRFIFFFSFLSASLFFASLVS